MSHESDYVIAQLLRHRFDAMTSAEIAFVEACRNRWLSRDERKRLGEISDRVKLFDVRGPMANDW